MEAARFNIKIALSPLTTGSPVEKSSSNGQGPCALEIELEGPNRGLRHICIALIHNKGKLQYYKPCGFDNGKCPLGQFTPFVKPLDTPLEKGNGR